MPHTTFARGTFPTRKAADLAVQRLVASGFARNSIDLDRHPNDEGYDVTVHTRQENLERVERLIHMSPRLYAVETAASGAVGAAKAHPVIILGLGMLAGLVFYNLFARADRSEHA